MDDGIDDNGGFGILLLIVIFFFAAIVIAFDGSSGSFIRNVGPVEAGKSLRFWLEDEAKPVSTSTTNVEAKERWSLTAVPMRHVRDEETVYYAKLPDDLPAGEYRVTVIAERTSGKRIHHVEVIEVKRKQQATGRPTSSQSVGRPLIMPGFP